MIKLLSQIPQHLLLSLLFLLTADLGVLSNADALIVGLVTVLTYADFLPHLLILIAMTQDAPGLSQNWSRIGMVVLCVVAVLRYLPQVKTEEIWYRSLRLIIAVSIAVIVIALLNSFAQHYLGGHLQDMNKRPPLFLSILMLLNIFAALAVAGPISRDRHISKTIMLTVTHGAVIALAQAVYGPDTLHSAAAILEIKSSYQLSTESTFGFPRLTGAFLSPNAFGLLLLHSILVLFALRPQLVRLVYAPWGFLGLAAFLMLFTQSKNTTFMAVIAAMYLFMSMRNNKKIFIYGCIFLSLAVALVAINFERIISGLRLNHSWTEGYRYNAIMVAWNSMSSADWVFGMGLSHWSILFSSALPFTLADPHIWVLSIPGTFGITGVILYGIVALWLLRYIRFGQPEQRFVSAMLLYSTLVVGLFDIPYLIGNTALTFMTWLTFTLVATTEMPHKTSIASS